MTEYAEERRSRREGARHCSGEVPKDEAAPWGGRNRSKTMGPGDFAHEENQGVLSTGPGKRQQQTVTGKLTSDEQVPRKSIDPCESSDPNVWNAERTVSPADYFESHVIACARNAVAGLNLPIQSINFAQRPNVREGGVREGRMSVYAYRPRSDLLTPEQILGEEFAQLRLQSLVRDRGNKAQNPTKDSFHRGYEETFSQGFNHGRNHHCNQGHSQRSEYDAISPAQISARSCQAFKSANDEKRRRFLELVFRKSSNLSAPSRRRSRTPVSPLRSSFPSLTPPPRLQPTTNRYVESDPNSGSQPNLEPKLELGAGARTVAEAAAEARGDIESACDTGLCLHDRARSHVNRAPRTMTRHMTEDGRAEMAKMLAVVVYLPPYKDTLPSKLPGSVNGRVADLREILEGEGKRSSATTFWECRHEIEVHPHATVTDLLAALRKKLQETFLLLDSATLQVDKEDRSNKIVRGRKVSDRDRETGGDRSRQSESEASSTTKDSVAGLLGQMTGHKVPIYAALVRRQRARGLRDLQAMLHCAWQLCPLAEARSAALLPAGGRLYASNTRVCDLDTRGMAVVVQDKYHSPDSSNTFSSISGL